MSILNGSLRLALEREEIEKFLRAMKLQKHEKENLLNQYGIQSLEEAEELNERYTTSITCFQNASANFKTELGDISYEELHQQSLKK